MNAKTFAMRRIGAPFALALALGATANAWADSNTYTQRNLVSDGFVAAEHTDADLVNAWGVAFNPFGFNWVANNGTGLSTLYDGDGNKAGLIVQIPTPSGPTGGPATGIVFNANGSSATSFPVGGVGSKFLFATEDGVIAGWPGGTQAMVAVDNSPSGAVYKGIALSAGGTTQLLYATDFHNARVDVFDNTFAPVVVPGAFTDPKLPAGYSPFGIQAIGGNIFVTYGKQQAGSGDEADGPGLGVVDVYDPNGVFLSRVATRGALNAPWGIAMAPAGFGKFSNTLLIGNFGDGTINAFDPNSYKPLGQLHGTDGKKIMIAGLWGIAFGNGLLDQPVNTLFFAAGPDDEAHGLYGRLDPPAPGAHGGGDDDQGGDD